MDYSLAQNLAEKLSGNLESPLSTSIDADEELFRKTEYQWAASKFLAKLMIASSPLKPIFDRDYVKRLLKSEDTLQHLEKLYFIRFILGEAEIPRTVRHYKTHPDDSVSDEAPEFKELGSIPDKAPKFKELDSIFDEALEFKDELDSVSKVYHAKKGKSVLWISEKKFEQIRTEHLKLHPCMPSVEELEKLDIISPCLEKQQGYKLKFLIDSRNKLSRYLGSRIAASIWEALDHNFSEQETYNGFLSWYHLVRLLSDWTDAPRFLSKDDRRILLNTAIDIILDEEDLKDWSNEADKLSYDHGGTLGAKLSFPIPPLKPRQYLFHAYLCWEKLDWSWSYGMFEVRNSISSIIAMIVKNDEGEGVSYDKRYQRIIRLLQASDERPFLSYKVPNLIQYNRPDAIAWLLLHLDIAPVGMALLEKQRIRDEYNKSSAEEQLDSSWHNLLWQTALELFFSNFKLVTDPPKWEEKAAAISDLLLFLTQNDIAYQLRKYDFSKRGAFHQRIELYLEYLSKNNLSLRVGGGFPKLFPNLAKNIFLNIIQNVKNRPDIREFPYAELKILFWLLKAVQKIDEREWKVSTHQSKFSLYPAEIAESILEIYKAELCRERVKLNPDSPDETVISWTEQPPIVEQFPWLTLAVILTEQSENPDLFRPVDFTERLDSVLKKIEILQTQVQSQSDVNYVTSETADTDIFTASADPGGTSPISADSARTAAVVSDLPDTDCSDISHYSSGSPLGECTTLQTQWMYKIRLHLRVLLTIYEQIQDSRRVELNPSHIIKDISQHCEGTISDLILSFSLTDDSPQRSDIFDGLYERAPFGFSMPLWSRTVRVLNLFPRNIRNNLLNEIARRSQNFIRLTELTLGIVSEESRELILKKLEYFSINTYLKNQSSLEVEKALIAAINAGRTDFAKNILDFEKKKKKPEIYRFRSKWERITFIANMALLYQDSDLSDKEKREAIENLEIPGADDPAIRQMPEYKHLENRKEFYIALLYLKENPEWAHHRFQTLLQKNPKQPDIAANCLAAHLQIAQKEDDEAKKFKTITAALQEWEDSKQQFTNEEYKRVLNTVAYNILNSYLELNEYERFDDLWKELDTPIQMQFDFIRLANERFKNGGLYDKRNNFIQEAKGYHAREGYLPTKESDDFFKQLEKDYIPDEIKKQAPHEKRNIPMVEDCRKIFPILKSLNPPDLVEVISYSEPSIENYLLHQVIEAAEELLIRKAILDTSKENELNDILESFLAQRLAWHNWTISSQQRGGFPDTGKKGGPGSLDIVIWHSRSMLSIIEALLYRGDKYTERHLNKLCKYDQIGLSPLFIVVYVNRKDFSESWKKHLELSNSFVYKGFDESEKTVKDITAELKCGTSIFVGEEKCMRNNYEVTVYHIFIDMSVPQN